MPSVIIALSIPEDLADEIDKAKNGFELNVPPLVFKRSPFYVFLLRKGLESLEKK